MRVGLDVGGTKTDAVAVDDAGTVCARVRLATGWGPDGVVQTVIEAMDALHREGVHPRRVRSVGVGMPGQVEPGTARVLHAVNLGVEDLDLAAAVGPRLGVPVAVENDVKAAALGAYALRLDAARTSHAQRGAATGAGAQPSSQAQRGAAATTMAYLNLGTGIAAGIVRDGRLWRGAHGTAGEVGHISVDPDGPVCRCGQRGCIEALAGGAAVAARWGRAAPYPVLDLLDQADLGDPHAMRLRADLMTAVAAAVRILILTTDADVVVLGGGLTALGDRLRDGVVVQLGAGAEASAFLRSLHLAERVELLPAGSPAAAFGAALIGAARESEQDPQEAVIHG